MNNLSRLPIHENKGAIVAALRENQVVVVVGETGSGKTTQLPCYLYAAGFADTGMIGITEPRRIAATSVAKFVAREIGKEDVVGYQVRFDFDVSEKTRIKFMTDGILLREFHRDSDLSRYSVIMVDEAHERGANIDFLLGLLKRLIARRKDLKIVVASATIDAEKFSRYFDGAPIITVSGRLHPIKVIHEPPPDERRVAEAVAAKVIAIHQNEAPGDILVFMTGMDDINRVLDILEEKKIGDLVALPAHGGVAPENLEKIFEEFPDKRKVVVATNIAETSITIDGVVYVVDSGLVKETHFHALSGIQKLEVVEHSQAGCNQRAGRAGRTQPGIVYRLYTEANFKERPSYTEPEIRRMSLAGIVLQMEKLDIQDIPNFDFLDPPDEEAFKEAYATLISLGAIKKSGVGLTELGERMARLPLEPRISRMLLEAEKYGCVEEVAIIAAFLSVRDVFIRPKDKQTEAESAHAPFKDRGSDPLAYLALWQAYKETGFDRNWCHSNFLHSGALWEAKNICSQLLGILSRSGIRVESSSDENAIVRSVAAGLIHNLFRVVGARSFAYSPIFRDGDYGAAFIHPGSALFKRATPHWLVASELVITTKLFMRGCSRVETGWLPEFAPARFSFGETTLLSYKDGEETVMARREVLFLNVFGEREAIGHTEVQVPLEEACTIQERSIAMARKKGWVLLSPSRWVPLSRIQKERVSLTLRYEALLPVGGSCEISPWGKVSVVPGRRYYCSFSELSNGKVAHAEFEILPLPPKKGKEAAGSSEPVLSVSVPPSTPGQQQHIASALEAFNARFKASK